MDSPPGPGFLLVVFKLLFMHADDIIKSVPVPEFRIWQSVLLEYLDGPGTD